jgi:putative transcriptional regulator
MTIQQHPELAWLIDYAAGNLSPGFHTVIAGHLGACDSCREQMRSAERLGAHITGERAQPSPRISAAAIRARAAEQAKPAHAAETAVSGLREFVAASLGFTWDALIWRPGVPGLRIARLKDQDDERIWLLHANPGAEIPEHTHDGAELTLILHGAYRTNDQLYRAGDIDENDAEITHRPIVTAESDCISLLVFEGRLQYTGLMGLAQRVLKF